MRLLPLPLFLFRFPALSPLKSALCGYTVSYRLSHSLCPTRPFPIGLTAPLVSSRTLSNYSEEESRFFMKHGYLSTKLYGATIQQSVVISYVFCTDRAFGQYACLLKELTSTPPPNRPSFPVDSSAHIPSRASQMKSYSCVTG
jgi:hypothetical protein